MATLTPGRPTPVPTDPIEPALTRNVSSSSAAASSDALQPTLKAPSIIPGPANKVARSSYEWISRHPIAAILSITIFLVVAVIVIMILTLNSGVQQLYGQIPYNVTGVAIAGHNCLLDLNKRTLSIHWEVMGCGEHRLSTYKSIDHFGGSETCGPFDRAVDIYLNSAITPVFSYDPDHLPVSLTEGSLYMQDLISFGKEHQMGVYAGSIYFPSTRTRHLFSQQMAAPFDTYILNTFVFVIDKATNKSVHITRFTIADPLDNFVTYSRDTETTNKFTYQTMNGTMVTANVESRALKVAVTRSIFAQAFTMCLLLVNWALTVGIVYLTLVILLKIEKLNNAVFALPITVVLTIPAIRALFIGSPPIGILIDIAGFFIQIILVGLCSLVLFFVLVKSSGSDQQMIEDSKQGDMDS